jgi:ABC-type glycerol-3-phosphate transport system permease component
MAASVLFSAPTIAIYFGGMKFFTKGLVMSGIK